MSTLTITLEPDDHSPERCIVEWHDASLNTTALGIELLERHRKRAGYGRGKEWIVVQAEGRRIVGELQKKAPKVKA